MPTEKTKETIEFFPERHSQVPLPHDPPDPAVDKALKDSFPASDPPAHVQPRPDDEVESAKDAAHQREQQEKQSAKRRTA